MKRKLLILLSIFAFILPLSGCEDDEKKPGEVTVTATVEKAIEEADTPVNINDCARIVSGPGNYPEGSTGVGIKIEFYKSACNYQYIEDGLDNRRYEGDYQTLLTSPQPSDANLQKVTIVYPVRNLKSGEDRHIRVIFTSKEGSVSGKELHFSGIRYTNTDGEVSLVKKGAFPYTTQSGASTFEVPAEGGLIKTISENSTLSQLFSNEINGEVDLNYVYFEGNVFKPRKLSWKLGKMNMGACSYAPADSIAIENISDFDLLGHENNVCLMAYLDDMSDIKEVTNKAVSNMLESEILIYPTDSATRPEAKCATANSAQWDEGYMKDSKCMYAMNLKALYNVKENDNKFVGFYYGVNDDGYLESVTTTRDVLTPGQYIKKYVVCTVPYASWGTGDNSICLPSDIYWYEYGYETVNNVTALNEKYKILEMADFIDSLHTKNTIVTEPESKMTSEYEIATGDIIYEYNYIVKDIVPTYIKSGSTYYHISYIGGKGKTSSLYNKGEAKYNFQVLPNESVKSYKLEYDAESDEEIEVLKGKIATNSINLMAVDDEALISNLTNTIFEIVYGAEHGSFTSLRGYYFTITIGENNVLTIEPVDAKINIEGINFVNKGSDITKESLEYCENLLESSNLDNNIKDYLIDDTNIRNTKFKSIVKNGDVLTFIFYDDPGAATPMEITVEYNLNEKTFTYNETDYRLLQFEDAGFTGITNITNTTHTILGDIVQSMNTVTGDISITLEAVGLDPSFASLLQDYVDANRQTINANINYVYSLFYAEDKSLKGTFYEAGEYSEDIAYIFVNSTDKTLVAIYSETADDYYVTHNKYNFNLTFAIPEPPVVE